MSETGPLFVSSGDLIADRRYQWALEQAARGDLAAAADILTQTVAKAPGFAAAWFALGEMCDRLGERADAIAAFEKARDADPHDRQGARLQLVRLGSGTATPAMTQAYVRRLFDQYAARYDAVLTEHLDYRAPAVLFAAVEAVVHAARRRMRFGAMLDLGCGTGLGGAAFRGCIDWLVGVDLSPAMIAQAAGKGLYDRLATGAMQDFLAAEAANTAFLAAEAANTAFLAAEAANTARYHLVLAADVLVYVNELAPIAAAVARVLAPGGLFAFTVEAHGGDGAKLLPTLRYAHGEGSIRRALADAGLLVCALAAAAVRSERGAPVDGLVVVAQRPSAEEHKSA
jgi:predicted TPR repeat methyltransferase